MYEIHDHNDSCKIRPEKYLQMYGRLGKITAWTIVR
jgi:hypothetical protein